jgi:hypothetical protein
MSPQKDDKPSKKITEPAKVKVDKLLVIIISATFVTLIIVWIASWFFSLPGFSPCQTSFEISSCQYSNFVDYCDSKERTNDKGVSCYDQCVLYGNEGDCSYADFCQNNVALDLRSYFFYCYQ